MQEKKLNQEEKIEADSEVLDFNKPDFKFIPPGFHDWVQRGYYLVCRSCELEHGVWVGYDKIIVGKNEKGEPIMKKRKDVGMV
jgi:hypothetical protein